MNIMQAPGPLRNSLLLSFLLSLLLLPPPAGAAGNPPAAPSKDTIESVLRLYPDCPLSASAVTKGAEVADDNMLAKMGDLIWARGFGNKDCSRVVIYTALYQGGSFLTADIKTQVARAVANRATRAANGTAGQPGAGEEVLFPEILDLGQNRRGYHFLVVYGPGGTETATALTSADGRYDLVLFRFYMGPKAMQAQARKLAQDASLPTADSASIITDLENALLQ